nr:cytochrome c [uncultured Janthinobacterium sp.]
MKRHFFKALCLLAICLPAGAAGFSAELVEKGRYLAIAADCMACHTAHRGKPMAGGLAMASPVGDIMSTNITPSKQFGIGKYTQQQFSDALRKGIRADGAPLYPAMPYTAYAVMSDADMQALYAYFMQAVPAVEQATAPTRLPFPMNIRSSMHAWNALFLNEQPLKPEPSRSPQWLRGRYLAEGAAHCSTCHTPRGVLMQEKADLFLGGAQVGAWHAPNITSHPTAGIGSWTQAELVQYLRTGRLAGKAQAAGSMAEAISLSFSRMSDADLQAIAVYIKDVPAVADTGQAPQPVSRFRQGQPGNVLASLRGNGYAAGMQGPLQGAQLYSANCASCHGASAQGTRDGYYPSLFHNSATVNTSNLLATILLGVDRKTAEGHVFMPPFGAQANAVTSLSDDEIAALANYIQASHGAGAHAPAVKAADVAVIRQGGPASPLLLLARLGMGTGMLAAAAIVFLVLRRRRRRALVLKEKQP